MLIGIRLKKKNNIIRKSKIEQQKNQYIIIRALSQLLVIDQYGLENSCGMQKKGEKQRGRRRKEQKQLESICLI